MIIKIISIVIYSVLSGLIFTTAAAWMVVLGAQPCPWFNCFLAGASFGGLMRAWYFATRRNI